MAPQAFRLRDSEVALSSGWLEFHAGTDDHRIEAVKGEFAAVLKIKRSDGFVRGNVGKIFGACLSYGLGIEAVHDADGFPSHASIMNFKDDQEPLLDLLAAEAWAEFSEPVLPVGSPPA